MLGAKNSQVIGIFWEILIIGDKNANVEILRQFKTKHKEEQRQVPKHTLWFVCGLYIHTLWLLRYGTYLRSSLCFV